MSQCSLFILTLIVLLFFEYNIFGKDIFAPSFVFCASFLIALINLSMNTGYWGTDLHWKTLGVLVCGIVSFSAPAFLIHNTYNGKINFNLRLNDINKDLDALPKLKIIYIQPLVKVVFLIFEILSIAITLIYILQTMGAGTLTAAIAGFRNATLFASSGESISLPTIISVSFFVTRRAGYVWAYVLANNYIQSKKIDIIILMNFLLSFFSPLAVGERGSMIELLIGVIIVFVMLYRYSSGKINPIKFRYIFFIFVILLIVLYSFTWLGNLIGRTRTDISETIFVYLGAPIFNLDTWLQKSYSAKAFVDNRTIRELIVAVGNLLGVSTDTVSSSGLIFRYANGHSVGNVYTTFATFFYDAGWFGVVCYSALMGIIVQTLYDKCRLKNNGSPFKYLLLTYFYPLVVLSFFGNRFYAVFDFEFIKTLVVWAFMFFIFTRFRFDFRFSRNF